MHAMLPNCLEPVVDWLCVRDVDAAQQGGESTAALDALASVIRSETEAQCSVAVPGWALRYVLRRPAADACEEPQTDEWLLWHGTALSWMCPRRPNATFSCSAVCRSGCTVIRQRNCGDEFPTEHNGTLCLGSIVHALAVL